MIKKKVKNKKQNKAKYVFFVHFFIHALGVTIRMVGNRCEILVKYEFGKPITLTLRA